LVVILAMSLNYFGWMSGLEFSFDKKTRGPIREMIIGSFTEMQQMFIFKANDLMVKVKDKYENYKQSRLAQKDKKENINQV
jgi:hypothetical protein